MSFDSTEMESLQTELGQPEIKDRLTVLNTRIDRNLLKKETLKEHLGTVAAIRKAFEKQMDGVDLDDPTVAGAAIGNGLAAKMARSTNPWYLGERNTYSSVLFEQDADAFKKVRSLLYLDPDGPEQLNMTPEAIEARKILRYVLASVVVDKIRQAGAWNDSTKSKLVEWVMAAQKMKPGWGPRKAVNSGQFVYGELANASDRERIASGMEAAGDNKKDIPDLFGTPDNQRITGPDGRIWKPKGDRPVTIITGAQEIPFTIDEVDDIEITNWFIDPESESIWGTCSNGCEGNLIRIELEQIGGPGWSDPKKAPKNHDKILPPEDDDGAADDSNDYTPPIDDNDSRLEATLIQSATAAGLIPLHLSDGEDKAQAKANVLAKKDKLNDQVLLIPYNKDQENTYRQELMDHIEAVDYDFDGILGAETKSREAFVEKILEICERENVRPPISLDDEDDDDGDDMVDYLSEDLNEDDEKNAHDFAEYGSTNSPDNGPIEKAINAWAKARATAIEERDRGLPETEAELSILSSDSRVLGVLAIPPGKKVSAISRDFNETERGLLRVELADGGTEAIDVGLLRREWRSSDADDNLSHLIYVRGKDEPERFGIFPRVTVDGNLEFVVNSKRKDGMDIDGTLDDIAGLAILPPDGIANSPQLYAISELLSNPETAPIAFKDAYQDGLGDKGTLTMEYPSALTPDERLDALYRDLPDPPPYMTAYLFLQLKRLGSETFLSRHGDAYFERVKKEMNLANENPLQQAQLLETLGDAIKSIDAMPADLSNIAVVDDKFGAAKYEDGWNHLQKFTFRQESRCKGFRPWFRNKLVEYQKEVGQKLRETRAQREAVRAQSWARALSEKYGVSIQLRDLNRYSDGEMNYDPRRLSAYMQNLENALEMAMQDEELKKALTEEVSLGARGNEHRVIISVESPYTDAEYIYPGTNRYSSPRDLNRASPINFSVCWGHSPERILRYLKVSHRRWQLENETLDESALKEPYAAYEAEVKKLKSEGAYDFKSISVVGSHKFFDYDFFESSLENLKTALERFKTEHAELYGTAGDFKLYVAFESAAHSEQDDDGNELYLPYDASADELVADLVRLTSELQPEE